MSDNGKTVDDNNKDKPEGSQRRQSRSEKNGKSINTKNSEEKSRKALDDLRNMKFAKKDPFNETSLVIFF